MYLDLACLLILVYLVHKVVTIEDRLALSNKGDRKFESMPEELKQLISEGKRIEAIKYLSRTDGISVSLAEKEVERLTIKLSESSNT